MPRSHPTPAMQAFGEMQRQLGLKRIRHEAAKKAWRTRRYLAKPSRTMRRVLEFLASSDKARVSWHYHGITVYYVSICCVNQDGSSAPVPFSAPRKLTRTTLRAMEKRGWLEFVRRREQGGTMGTLPDGTHGVVTHSFCLDYRINDKGRKALIK